MTAEVGTDLISLMGRQPAAPARPAAALPLVPRMVADEGGYAARAYAEFLTATIRNQNTRAAYARAGAKLFAYLEARGIERLGEVGPIHIAAFVEDLGLVSSVPTVKQNLAGIRHLFDKLVVAQVVPFNPAASVRGPRHVTRKGRTPVLTPQEARQLLDAIRSDTLIGLRDRALSGTMVYAFSRVGAATNMKAGDLFRQRSRLWIRLSEKGGRQHEMPCHHTLEEYLDDYVEAAGLADQPKAWLFQPTRKRDELAGTRLLPQRAFEMVRRRAAQAGIDTPIGNHTFRATGITTYLKNGGTLENAAQMAAHASTRTTQLYDRRSEEVMLDEVERVMV